MAKTYINKTQGTDAITKARNITVAAPFDVRTVVDTYNDLLNKETFTYNEMYVGMMVTTVDTQDVYVLSVLPGSRVNAANWPNTIVWKQIGSNEAVIDPADNLDYYQEKLGTKVFDSVDDLTSASLEDAYAGMLAVVKGGSSDSEDESGLYILTRTPNTTASNWYRILGGSGSGNASSGLDVSEVITMDGSAPAAGTGFSISGNDPDAIVEETYIDNGFKGGEYYAGRGLNSYDKNGGEELEDVDYITLTNGGDSYIRFNSSDNDNWIEVNIVDDSLGFTMDDVTYIDANGDVQQMTSSPLVLPKETPISFGENDIDLYGMTETRGTDPTEYEFGNDGSAYEDIDIYRSDVLPTVYVYADGESVRVLTEGDKDEIINKIDDMGTFEPITNEEILGLF